MLHQETTSEGRAFRTVGHVTHASAVLILALVLTLGVSACGDDDSENESDAIADTLAADTGEELGSVEVTGNWDGDFPADAEFRVSLFDCPFSMPPKYYFFSTIEANGDVYASQDEVEPGEHCLMAYVDIDSEDGLAPVVGLDPTNATGEENSEGVIPIQVVAGETTVVPLVFEIRP